MVPFSVIQVNLDRILQPLHTTPPTTTLLMREHIQTTPQTLTTVLTTLLMTLHLIMIKIRPFIMESSHTEVSKMAQCLHIQRFRSTVKLMKTDMKLLAEFRFIMTMKMNHTSLSLKETKMRIFGRLLIS